MLAIKVALWQMELIKWEDIQKGFAGISGNNKDHDDGDDNDNDDNNDNGLDNHNDVL